MSEQDIQKTESEDVFTKIHHFYTNSVKISMAYFDVQLLFATTALNTITDKPVAMSKAEAVVHMSPQHFKVMVDIFNTHLAKYEEEFGKIPVPPEKEEK